MEIKEIRNKLFEKLEGTGWDNALRFFIKSDEFEDVLTYLYNEVDNERRFTPALKDWFKPLVLCPLDHVKVVFLVPQGTTDPSLENGLAISCNESIRPSMQLYRLKAELAVQYPNHSLNTGDMSYLASQGILLYNCSITNQIGKLGQHFELWKSFLLYIINILNKKEGLIWCLFGDTGMEPRINKNHEIINLKRLPSHRDEVWSSEGLFIKINEELKLKNKSKIVW